MNQSSDRTYIQWKKFIQGKKIDEREIPEHVLSAWKKSREKKIDPYHQPVNIISDEKFANLKKRYSVLIDAVQPILKMLHISARDEYAKAMFCLSDGTILLSTGDIASEELKTQKPHQFCLSKTIRRIETSGGCAVSLSLNLKKPISLLGSEHYIQPFHRYACFAAPIFNPDNEIMGSIATSCFIDKIQSSSLSLITIAAESITARVKEQELLATKERLHSMLSSVYNAIPEGIIALDRHNVITHANKNISGILNSDAKKIIGTSFLSYIFSPEKELIKSLLEKNRSTNCEVSFPSGKQNYMCRLKPIYLPNRKRAGTILTITSQSEIIKMAAQFSSHHAGYRFNDIKGKSGLIKSCVKLAQKAAKSDSRILISGESGTGKELFAQAIHNHSKRRNAPFVAISCAAIPKNLIESEFFGYVGGAFTGAKKGGSPGKFEIANKGTLFLDEINSLPLNMQGKLLRVLQQSEVMRIGSIRTTLINVRVLAATNVNLYKAVENGSFREDLYYRINVFEIKIPPLKDRKEDISVLVQHILKKHSPTGRATMSKAALQHLKVYDWKGNIRELENACEHAIILSEDGIILPDHLPRFLLPKMIHATLHEDLTKKIKPIEEQYKEQILQAISLYNGNMTKAAQALGISRTTLYRKAHKFKIV